MEMWNESDNEKQEGEQKPKEEIENRSEVGKVRYISGLTNPPKSKIISNICSCTNVIYHRVEDTCRGLLHSIEELSAHSCLVCFTAVISVVTQRSSPLTAAENRTTFLSLCVCDLTKKPITYLEIECDVSIRG